jgi:predicted metal-dependent peptidase
MNLDDKLKRAKIQLILRHPWLSHAVLHIKTITGDLPRSAYACVFPDGRVILDRNNTEGLNVNQLITILAHEILHLLFLHFLRRGTRNPEKWNVACDIAVNNWLKSFGFELVLDTGKYSGIGYLWSAEKIYEKLPEVDFREKELLDIHCEDSGEENEELMRKWYRVLLEVKNSLKQRGDLPAGFVDCVNEILHPGLSWRQLLLHFISQKRKSGESWTPPNIKMMQFGFLLPYYYEEFLKLGIAIDTSGSITHKELQLFAGSLVEIMSLIKSEITLLLCDAEIQDIRKDFELHDLFSLQFKGGGGTDFRPVFKYICEKHIDLDCLIYLTDGAGTFPKPQDVTLPTLWVLTRESPIPSGIGEKIVMEGNMN